MTEREYLAAIGRVEGRMRKTAGVTRSQSRMIGEMIGAVLITAIRTAFYLSATAAAIKYLAA